jgi:hypothetical protein
LLLPLVLLAWRSVRDDEGIARNLAIGILLSLVTLFVVLPFQGHGWGYRYFHGLIGSFVLLATYGWVTLATRFSTDETGRAFGAMALTSLFAILVLFPLHLKDAHDFAAPYARASEAIKAAKTDLVLVDSGGMRYGEDLVRNDPFLRNRPLVLDKSLLSDADIADLCANYSMSLFGAPQGVAAGIFATGEAQVERAASAAPTEFHCGASLDLRGRVEP